MKGPWPSTLFERLESRIRLRPSFCATQYAPYGKEIDLFVNTKKSAEKRIARELVRLCQKAGIEKVVTPHALRATVATFLHEKGVPVVHIQRLLN